MDRLTFIEKYLKSSTTPTINVTDVTLSLNETFRWIFSRLSVNVLQCNINPIDIIVQSDKKSYQIQHLVENPEIIIHNSSFGSLDLNPGSKAQITDCYIDAQFKPRPTLITANNSDVSIQNCHFRKFINENGSTVLYGHYYSHVIIENSVFIQHNSSKGVLFLQINSSMGISSSLILQNIASSPGYSTISLQDGIHAEVHDTVFRNNSALVGGAMFAQDECRVTLTNSTFSSNKAITGEKANISKRAARSLDQNNKGTITPMSPTLFNQTSSGDKKPEGIAAHQSHLLTRSSILMKSSARHERASPDLPPYTGGAIYVERQSQVLIKNCTFEYNLAQYAGAIAATSNTTLDIQETTFVSNKALTDGGAIVIQGEVHLKMTKCFFEDNICQRFGAAITATGTTTLEIQDTIFTRNRAVLDGGAIDVEQQSYLCMIDCTFEDNRAGRLGGVISAAFNATLEIKATNFTGNSAAQGGVIDVQQVSILRMADCTFEGNSADRYGGAIFCGYNITLDTQDTNFTRNRGSQGGAICVQHASNLHVTKCTFEDNHAEQNGGAIDGAFNATLDILETNFIRNTASQGGAYYVDQQSLLRMTDCTCEGNHAEQLGGAIGSSNTTIEIHDCTFEGNHADQGGAIFVIFNVTLGIHKTDFTRNTAFQGGAIYVSHQTKVLLISCSLECNLASDSGGAIIAWTNSKLKIRETNFTGNIGARFGGSLFFQQTEIHLVRCIIHGSTTKELGGGVYIALSSLEMKNTNFTENNSTAGGAIFVGWQTKIHTELCNFTHNSAKEDGGAIKIFFSTATILGCHFQSNSAVRGGAMIFIHPQNISMNGTFFLRNVASYDGGAIAVNIGNDVIINYIRCVGNRGAVGGCMSISSTTITLNNSDISENYGDPYAAGIEVMDSRMQVGVCGFMPIGGSRIVLGAVPTRKCFAESCMKMKEFGPPRRLSLAPPPWIRQLDSKYYLDKKNILALEALIFKST